MSDALRVRVTPAERQALERLAKDMGRPVSHLLRRAIREMITGGPDFFDDGVAVLSQAIDRFGRLERRLGSDGAGSAEDLVEVKALLVSTRAGFALQVRRSRQRWAPQERR